MINAKKSLAWTIAAVGVMVVAGACGNSRPAEPSAATAKVTIPTAKAPPASQIGATVKDGSFAFVVKSLSCGADAASAVSAGGEGESVPAGAKECLVTMSVTNDKSAGTYFATNQYAFDAAGHKYKADDMATAFLPNANDATQLNPGITITAVLPFQVPAGVTLTRLELHDSAFSGGVSVRL